MPTTETAIWLALRARVESLVLTPSLPMAWPNEAYSPNPSQDYLRVNWLQNTNRRMLIGAGPHLRPGLLQISVMAKKNQNVAVALEIAGKVAAHFPADLCMSAYGVSCRVTRAPDIAQPIADDAFLMVPVTVPVETYA